MWVKSFTDYSGDTENLVLKNNFVCISMSICIHNCPKLIKIKFIETQEVDWVGDKNVLHVAFALVAVF